MRGAPYPIRFLAVLLKHSGVWWVGAFTTTSAGLGLAIWYHNLLPYVMEWAGSDLANDLPDEFPAWWILLIVGAYVLISSLHAQVTRNDLAPRLFLENPHTVITKIEFEIKDTTGRVIQKDTNVIEIARIAVRNQPISEDGHDAKDAHASVVFTPLDGSHPFITMRYPRWSENDKPRPDTTPTYLPRPKFQHAWNFRTLSANNSPNHIDFVIMVFLGDRMYGFSGAGQDLPFWHDDHFDLSARKYVAEITIEASGLRSTVKRRFIIERKHILEVYDGKFLGWENWIGTG